MHMFKDVHEDFVSAKGFPLNAIGFSCVLLFVINQRLTSRGTAADVERTILTPITLHRQEVPARVGE